LNSVTEQAIAASKKPVILNAKAFDGYGKETDYCKPLPGGKFATKKVLKRKSKQLLFEMVQNPLGWKYPTVMAYVEKESDAELLVEALIHYSGGGHKAKHIAGGFQVWSAGYYVHIGA